MKKIEASLHPSRPAESLPLILYVEDDDDNWNVARLRLEKNYRLIRAATDAQACQLYARHVHELYVVLMDIELQGSQLDGVELTRLMRGRLMRESLPPYGRSVPTSNVPIVFVTAYHQTLTPELAAAGGDLLIPKPVKFMDLIRALTSLHLKNIGPGVA